RGSAGEVGFVAYGVHGDPGYLRGDRLFPASSPFAAAALEGSPVIAPPDAVVPMIVRGEIVGAIHERSDEDGAPDEERGVLLGGIADQLGLVLESARLRADRQALAGTDRARCSTTARTSDERAGRDRRRGPDRGRARRSRSDGGRPQPADPGPHEPRAQRHQVLTARRNGGTPLENAC